MFTISSDLEPPAARLDKVLLFDHFTTFEFEIKMVFLQKILVNISKPFLMPPPGCYLADPG